MKKKYKSIKITKKQINRVVGHLDFIDEFCNSGTIISLNSGKLLLGWGKRHYYPKPQRNYCFYLNDFFLKKIKPWFTHTHTIVLDKKKLLNLLNGFINDTLDPIVWESLDYDFFSKSFVHLLNQYLMNGSLEKGVPYTFERGEGTVNGVRLIHSLKNLISQSSYNKIYIYGSWDKTDGILGGTPEILFRKQSNIPNKVESFACAGTVTNSKDIQSILSDQKELNEHHLVIKGITEALKPFGRVDVKKMIIAKFPHLCHLFTPITLHSQIDLCFDTLTHLLHPTPALGSYPKKGGIEWLSKLQKSKNRMYFGAPFGYSYGNEASCYVAIRNMQWKKKEIFLGAGCGVVNQSIVEKEWDEILLKLESIKKLLAL